MREQNNLEMLEGEIATIASVIVGIPSCEFNSTDRLVEDLGADSLAMFEFRSKLEESFKVVIPDIDVGHLQSVRNATEYLSRRFR